MSNIGKKPIPVKDGVSVTIQNNRATVSGPKGNLETALPRGIKVEIADGQIKIKKEADNPELEKYVGLARALLSNMVAGVSSGFEKKLELSGVGYRARVDGRNLVLNVGYAVPITITPQEGITIQVNEGVISVTGTNKQLVGDTAANIRAVRPPDAYKGKGIKYVGEKLRKKVGKAAKAVGAK